MKLNNLFNNPKLYEILIILIPVCLLFSNLLSEIIFLFLVVSAIYKIKFEIFRNKTNDLILFLLIFISFYLVFNFFINIDKNPSITRSFFFIRFLFYAYSLYLILENFDVNINKIFFGWLIISVMISLDIFFQYIFGKNILGYPSILQGDFHRLGGFLNDELKIANLIIHIFVPVLAYFHKFHSNKFKHQMLLFGYVLLIFISIFLTGERSNFITLSLFLIIYIILTDLRKKFFYLFLISLPILIIFFKIYEPNLTKRMTTNLYNIYKKNLIYKNENAFFYKNNQYFAHYSTALEIAKDYPIFGVGLKNFRNYCNNDNYNDKIHPHFIDLKCSTHPHNFYFEIISETGFLGLIIFLVSFFIIFTKFVLFSIKKKDNFLFGNSLILIIYFIPLLPKGSFFTNWNAMIFWLVFALCIYSYKNKKHD